MFAAGKACTLLYPSGPSSDPRRNHLFIVLTDPCGPARQVLMVPVCTIATKNYDPTCVLDPGDHPFIKEASYVDYSLARIEAESALQNGVKAGVFIERENVSEALYTRIVKGVRASRFTKRFVKNFLDDSDSKK